MADAIVQQRDAFAQMYGQITVRRAQIEKLLPKEMEVERFVQQVHFALSKNKQLLECTPASVISSVLQLADLGLDPSGVLGSGYLAPFRNHGTLECVAIPGYRGLTDLAVRSGEVKAIYADVVFWGDEFDWQKGDRPKLWHKPKVPQTKEEQLEIAQARTWDNVRAAYAVATLPGGLKQFEVMLFEDLELARRRAPGGKSDKTPWAVENRQEPAKGGSRIQMYKKTPIRQIVKQLPLSPVKARKLLEAIALEDTQVEEQQEEEREEEKKKGRDGTQAIREALAKQAPPEPTDAEYVSEEPPPDMKLP